MFVLFFTPRDHPDLLSISSSTLALQVSSSMELSLVDGRPRELLVATLDGLGVEYHMGSTGGIDYVQFSARLRNAQVSSY